MLDHILQILQWAAPTGLGAALVWLLSREVRQAQNTEKVHQAYKRMYEDVSDTLTQLRQDYDKIYTICTRMEHALTRASVCRYWPQCPIRDELPEQSYVRGLYRNHGAGQHVRKLRRGDPDGGDSAGSGGHGVDEDSADEPP